MTALATEETRHNKRIAIVTLYDIGKRAPEIHRDFGIPERTIRGVIKKGSCQRCS